MIWILVACVAANKTETTDTAPAIVVDSNEQPQDTHPLYGSWTLTDDQPYGLQTLINPVMTYGPAGFMLSADEGRNQDGSIAFRSFATCGQAEFIPDEESSDSGQIITSPLNVEGAYTLRYRALSDNSVVLMNDIDGDGVFETEQQATRTEELMLQFEHPFPTDSNHLIIELSEIAGAIPSETSQLEYRSCRAEDLLFSESNGQLTIQNGVDLLGQKPLLRLPIVDQISVGSDLQLNGFQWPRLVIEALTNNQLTVNSSINSLSLIAVNGGRIVALENSATEVEVSASGGAELEVAVSDHLSGTIDNASLRYLGDPVLDVVVGENGQLSQIE